MSVSFPLSLSLSISLCFLSFCPSFCQSFSLSLCLCLPLYLSICLSIHLFLPHSLSLCLFLFLFAPFFLWNDLNKGAPSFVLYSTTIFRSMFSHSRIATLCHPQPPILISTQVNCQSFCFFSYTTSYKCAHSTHIWKCNISIF